MNAVEAMVVKGITRAGVLGLLCVLGVYPAVRAIAQTSGAAAQAPATATSVDKYDRNAQLWTMQRAGFASGWQRGQEIYYMRCWICHNEYTVVAEPGAAPSLRNLYKELKAGGEPVDEQPVINQIRRGSSRMPAYTQANLSDNDLADLLLYLREKCGTFPTGGGCFDEHNPPPNPNYKGK